MSVLGIIDLRKVILKLVVVIVGIVLVYIIGFLVLGLSSIRDFWVGVERDGWNYCCK